MARDITKRDIYQSAVSVIAEESMEHMPEMEFDFMKAANTQERCPHSRIVKLYYSGMHSNYGCIDCKKKSLNLQDFITCDPEK